MLGLIMGFAIQAQEAPKMWIGGGVGFGSQADLGDFTIAPSWGMMINDVMGFGVPLNYSGGNNTSSWSVDPYFRYYLKTKVDNFAFYGDAYVSFGGSDIAGTSNTFWGLGARAGMQYWFTPRWSVAASTNVISYTDSDDFGAGLDFRTVNLALFFHF